MEGERRGSEEMEEMEDWVELELDLDGSEHGCPPLITACTGGRTEVIQQLLESGADVTLCDSEQRTALHACPPDLQGALLGWMTRPQLSAQAQMLQAAWRGDLRALQNLLAQTGVVKVHVNATNSEGVTALMLAIRDIDLFEGLLTPLPWEHRPVEVVKELLTLSIDLCAHDRSGCSTFDYAVNVNSPLKEEIVYMMLEALKNTDAAPYPPRAPDKHFFQDLELEPGDPGPALDLESLEPGQLPGLSLTQHQHLLTGSHVEEVQRPSENTPLSLLCEASGRDKSPVCFQNTMETLRDIRQAYQDAERGGSRGLSLPSLNDQRTRPLGPPDPGGPPGLLQTSTCLPVAPRPRNMDAPLRPRGRSLVGASSPSLLSAPQPQLSQSAPSVMEPLLHSSALLQARAHIQTRLGTHEIERSTNGRKGSLPALRPSVVLRTPKLLAPLGGGTREQRAAAPEFKHHTPLKPIGRTPLGIRTKQRGARLSWSGPRLSLSATRGGSEESGSGSSSHCSSIDMDDEEEEYEKNSRGRTHISAYPGDGLPLDLDVSIHLEAVNYSRAESGCKAKVQHVHVIGHVALIHSSVDAQGGETLLTSTRDSSTSEEPEESSTARPLDDDDDNDRDTENRLSMKLHCEKREDTVNHPKNMTESAKNEMPYSSYTAVENIDTEYRTETLKKISNGIASVINNSPDVNITFSERKSNTRPGDKQNKVERKISSSEDVSVESVDGPSEDGRTLGSVEDMKLSTGDAALKRSHYLTPTVNLTLSETARQGEEREIKPIRIKERASVNYKLRANVRTNQSFNIVARRDTGNGNKSKGNLRTSVPKVKGKVSKIPDLIINGEAAVNREKSKLIAVKATPRNTDSPSPQQTSEQCCPKTQSSNADKSPPVHPPGRVLKSARQPKRVVAAGALRSKSALDHISYKDMFHEIQSGDEGPAIYEMFAGPIYDNLRISSSCDNLKDGPAPPTPSKKTHRGPKIKPQASKKQLDSKKPRRSPVENMVVSARGKPKTVASGAKPCLLAVQRKDTPEIEGDPKLDWHTDVAELLLTKDDEDMFPQNEDYMLSVIEEVQSRYDSETLKPDEKSIAGQTQGGLRSRPTRNSSGKNDDTEIGNTNRAVPEPPQSPLQPKINTWTSAGSDGTMSPVYRKFLDELGEGPPTDDLLQCLAQELISLDERDASMDLCSEDLGCSDEGPAMGRRQPSEAVAAHRAALGGLAVDDSISWTRGEVLGRGAYGTVYCGLTGQGQLIAVKQVSLDASDPRAADSEYGHLQREVELLKNLRHANIVGFLGTSLRQHVVSIFMEYVPGGSIASILSRFGPLPERVLALYTRQILEGVAYLHLNRVVHRDLKGNNMMLMPTGVVKLIDFGCARRLSLLNHTASTGTDLIKSVRGTPYWMAPEVINESGHGRKSDIWSVGCTVFEMATGKPPLAHMDKMAALFYIGAQRGLMPSLHCGFSHSARDFVQICLTSDQKARPSAEQLLNHPFVPNNMRVNSSDKKRRCAHPEGMC